MTEPTSMCHENRQGLALTRAKTRRAFPEVLVEAVRASSADVPQRSKEAPCSGIGPLGGKRCCWRLSVGCQDAIHLHNCSELWPQSRGRETPNAGEMECCFLGENAAVGAAVDGAGADAVVNEQLTQVCACSEECSALWRQWTGSREFSFGKQVPPNWTWESDPNSNLSTLAQSGSKKTGM